MYVLLSSAASARYRDDVLRCLAAPIGSRIQFRYDEPWVAPNIYPNPQEVKGQEALVCFIDHDAHDDQEVPFPMVPVRCVEIKNAERYGTALILDLEMKDFAYVERVQDFTDEISQGKRTPRISQETGRINGWYFFSITQIPNSVEKGKSLELWQKIINQLFQYAPFQNEPLFWTILGLHEVPTSVEHEPFTSLPNELRGARTYHLAIYHYHPTTAPSDETLAINCGGSISLFSAEEIKIDCRYDLKRTRLQTQRGTYRQQTAWITIGQENRWLLEMTIPVRKNLFRPIISIAIALVGFAIPNIPEALISGLPGWLRILLIVAGGSIIGLAIVIGADRGD